MKNETVEKVVEIAEGAANKGVFTPKRIAIAAAVALAAAGTVFVVKKFRKFDEELDGPAVVTTPKVENKNHKK